MNDENWVLDWVHREHEIRVSVGPANDWHWRCSCKTAGPIVASEEQAFRGAALHQKDIVLTRTSMVMDLRKREAEAEEFQRLQDEAIASIERTIRGE